MTDTKTVINWEARENAVNAAKVEWLDNNKDHLLLLQSHITRAWDNYNDSLHNNAEEVFIMELENAIPSLIRILCDLRQQDFIEQAKAKHPEAF